MKVFCELGPLDGKTIIIPEGQYDRRETGPGLQCMLLGPGGPVRYGETRVTLDDEGNTPLWRWDPFSKAEEQEIRESGIRGLEPAQVVG